MKYHQKLLYNRSLSLVIVGCVAFGGCNDFKKHEPLENRSLAQRMDYGRMAASEITACKNFSDLKKRLPAFSAYLERIAKEKDAKTLHDLYETLHSVMLDIMDNTRNEDRKMPYIDDLVFIGRLFEEEKTTSTKKALVFLSLPRLWQRAIILPWDKDISERIRRHTEEDFLLFLEERGFSNLSAAIKRYWYKENGALPSEKDEMEFFRSFAELY